MNLGCRVFRTCFLVASRPLPVGCQAVLLVFRLHFGCGGMVRSGTAKTLPPWGVWSSLDLVPA